MAPNQITSSEVHGIAADNKAGIGQEAAALRARGFRVRMHRAYTRPSVATLIETAANIAELGVLLVAVRRSNQVNSRTVRKCERAAHIRMAQLSAPAAHY